MRAKPLALLFLALFAQLVSACAGAPLPRRPTPARISDSEELVREYYRRVNAEDLSGVLAVMVREPTLREPFSDPGRATVHRGYEGVGRWFQRSFQTRDDQVVPEYVSASGSRVTVGWSLHGADGVGVSGTSRFDIAQGLISTVTIELRE